MIQTGKTPISVMTFCAILSISLIVNLPGLAVTPMLGSLSKIFPDTTQLEKQLLTLLPNLAIIPFVFLSGKLSLSRHKTGVIVTALLIFTACSIAYLFADSMVWLIVVSCILGCGAGLIIPFSKGLISDTFAGKYRMDKMGLVSGISNSSLVIATFAVGWLSHGNWHLPFIVYLVCLVPLALSFWLREIPKNELIPESVILPESRSHTTASATEDSEDNATKPSRSGIYFNKIWALIGVYAFITFSTVTVSYFCPFLSEKHDWSPTLTGTVTALYYLFILIPGFSLPWIIKLLKGGAFFYAALLMTIGIALFAFFQDQLAMCIGSSLAGLGYGICQPLIYDKASHAVSSDSKSTLALALVLSSNYIAIVATPLIIDGLRNLLHAQSHQTFAFFVCFISLTVYTAISFICRKKFAFSVNKSFY